MRDNQNVGEIPINSKGWPTEGTFSCRQGFNFGCALVSFSINHLCYIYISAYVYIHSAERLQGKAGRREGRRSRIETLNSHRLAAKKPGDASPTIVDSFSSPERDADISTYSFSSFRLLVKSLSLPVAKQQKQQALYISIRQRLLSNVSPFFERGA